MHSFQAGCEWFSRSRRIVRNHCLFEQTLIVLAFGTAPFPSFLFFLLSTIFIYFTDDVC
ncbi:hypothetical protein SAMN05421736_102403 [Evansella caseinilytica]|uniref:Uncharacterized protein n=1 Tax=Evansella caseinilytica TaxID=1503961 RepID=A0A1H3L921_9BACI|nr:hypothetical protein SAMN05421736_102403 [Evansella caseinilytica]